MIEPRLDYSRKLYAVAGDRVTLLISHSECAMWMQVAGLVLEVELQPTSYGWCMAQLYRDGREFSAPITTGEAGFYHDDQGFYYYPVLEVTQ